MNKNPPCPLCKKLNTIKNGKRFENIQSYKCSFCHYQFTKPPRYSDNDKAIALALHIKGISSTLIAKLFGAKPHTICRWVLDYKTHASPPPDF
ncbi:MAG: hypothetical protein LBF12_04925 [Christensenellaceae bacterium]|jgi:transposase-like protein|nr:hypothetical protein [Christensenellaceae bacterium]